MIAIYVRQSIDKKDSLSIDTQINFCLKEIESTSKYTVYKDKGFSGKNVDRPEFKKLMTSIRNKEISKLIVYRLDRISRSITDFANIIDILEEHNVDFISANEKFDTSTPVGKAMLYIIMVFAQLERETIAERIKDNYYSRGKTGVWLGGTAPIGFKNEKIKKDGKIVATIAPTEDLELVKKIYDLYANTNSSLGGIAKEIRKNTDEMWNNIKLSRILQNPAYVKADVDIYHYYKSKKCIIVNDIEEFTGVKGCNLYGKRERSKNKYRNLEDHVLSISLHDGIIDSQTWLICQRKLAGNVQIKNTGKGKHTWLTGLVKCGYCGYSMNVKVYKNYKYLNCSGRYIKDNICSKKLETHHVQYIEDYIEQSIKSFLPHLSNHVNVNKPFVNEVELNKLKMELFNIETQIDNLLNNMANGNETLIAYINKKIIELDKNRERVLISINENSIKPVNLDIPNIDDWNNYSLEQKRDVCNKLISKILIYNGKIEVEWKY